jgi:hypothetical protein
MFRNTVPATAAASDVVTILDGLIPLSHLKLDLPEPGEGWSAFLAARDVDVEPDELGRPSVTRSAARMLIAEQAADEARKALLRQDAERRAVEVDRLRRAQIWRGIPADMIPEGLSPATAMLAAAHDERPRRMSVLQEALSNSGELTYHSLAEES